MAVKHMRGLILIVFGLAATNFVGPVQAETISLWCGNDQTGYDAKFTVDFEKSTVDFGGINHPASINAYRIAWETRETMPWHGGVAISINRYSIDRVAGVFSHDWMSWVEDGGSVQNGTEESGKLGDLKCVKGDKPPAPVTKF